MQRLLCKYTCLLYTHVTCEEDSVCILSRTTHAGVQYTLATTRTCCQHDVNINSKVMKAEETLHPELAALSFFAFARGAANSIQGAKLHPAPSQTAHGTVPCMHQPPVLGSGISHTAQSQRHKSA
ncbi:hypothetical protein ABBQ32_013224 [Trebouxia sp. C0010 RCD-2024]